MKNVIVYGIASIKPKRNGIKVQGSFFIPGKTFIEHQLLDVNKIHYILASADIQRLLPDVCERMNHYRDQDLIILPMRSCLPNMRKRIALIARKSSLSKECCRRCFRKD